MERLTSNKQTSDMNMLELAYNSCYTDENRNARYRNYELDIDSLELVKNLAKDMCNEDLHDMSDEEFDEYMSEMLSVEIDSQIGLLALFYRNLWAMADLRERLKDYEDLEEQGRLLKLPYKVGDTVYVIDKNYEKCKNKDECINFDAENFLVTWCEHNCYKGFKGVGIIATEINGIEIRENDIFTLTELGYRNVDNIFLTKSEAEAKLKELRGNQNGKV